jgi:hypothetical protein
MRRKLSAQDLSAVPGKSIRRYRKRHNQLRRRTSNQTEDNATILFELIQFLDGKFLLSLANILHIDQPRKRFF